MKNIKNNHHFAINWPNYIKVFTLRALYFLASAFALILILFRSAPYIYANPLLNINSEDKAVYDIYYGSIHSYSYTTTISPMSMYKALAFTDNYEKVRLYLNAKDDIKCYVKPLNSVSANYYYTTAKTNSFIPGRSGLDLEKGSNIFLFQDGYLSLGRHFVGYYQLKETFNSKNKKIEAFRAYGKLLFSKLSLEGGIDNLNLGPGEYGMLLSNNAPPYPIVKLQTEDHLNFLGKWDFVIAHAWLIEDRKDEPDPQYESDTTDDQITNKKDYNNPKLIAIRLTYKPIDYLEFGVTRTTLYGGDGRPKYKYNEYPKMLAGTDENIPNSKYDNDAYASYDISLFLPLYKIIPYIKATNLYFQHGCTDIKVFWQKEDSGYKGIRFMHEAYQGGIFLSTKDSFLRLELFKSSNLFYVHDDYSIKGYYYKDMCLGYPFGKGINCLLLKYRFYIMDSFSFEIFGCLYYMYDDLDIDVNPEQNKMKRYFTSLTLEYKLMNYFIIETYFSYESAKNTDTTPSTLKFTTEKEDEKYFTAGISLSLRI